MESQPTYIKATMAPANCPESTFLSFPFEIRNLIYNYCIPPSRLTPFPLGDTEWSMRPTDNTEIVRNPPPLIFTCRKIYNETAKFFYSRATLEVAPAQQGNNWFNIRLAGKLISHAYSRLLSTFRFYNPDHLRCIRQAHVYSNQVDVIDGECYEALLQWLVEHTSVESIQLSSRPMTRIRGKASFDLPPWRAVFDHTDVRLVRVWTKANRPLWEYEKMMRLHCLVSNGTLVPMQIYFWADAVATLGASNMEAGEDSAAQQQLQLDPRWLTKRHDEEERIKMTSEAASRIDALMGRVLHGQELLDYRNNSRHFNGESWVYQMIVIAKT